MLSRRLFGLGEVGKICAARKKSHPKWGNLPSSYRRVLAPQILGGRALARSPLNPAPLGLPGAFRAGYTVGVASTPRKVAL
jgi:hypothetical protein